MFGKFFAIDSEAIELRGDAAYKQWSDFSEWSRT